MKTENDKIQLKAQIMELINELDMEKLKRVYALILGILGRTF